MATTLDLGNIHAGHGINRLEACRSQREVIIQDGHDVAVGMDKRDDAECPQVLDLTVQVGGYELAELGG